MGSEMCIRDRTFILWACLTFSVIPYMVIAAVAVQPKEDVVAYAFVAAIGGMAIFNLVLSIGMRKWLMQPKVLLAGQESPEDLMAKHFPLNLSHLIMIWAVAESAAIFGLVLSFVAGDAQYAIGFGILTIVIMLVFHRPRRLTAEDFLD